MQEITDTKGYYKVGERHFYSKSQALIEATQTGIHPTWHFGDLPYGLMNWESGAQVEDLRTVYQRRAQQLRDNYDHIVLSYSGGSDSWTVLNSFLSAGLTVDEILVRWPVKATSNKYQVSTDKDPANILSEWDLVVKPTLNYIATHYPKIKITVHDWSDDMDVELKEDDWWGISDYLNPGVFKKYTGLVGTDTDLKLLDRDRKVATVWGIDKPQMAYKDGNIYVYFLDKLANTTFTTGSGNRIPELFYWSPSFPEVVYTQARLLYDYFVTHPDKLDLIDWDKRKDITHEKKKEYDRIVRSIVYPDWDTRKFQADKPSSTVYNETDTWIFTQYSDNRYFESWQHGLKSIKNAVDPKYHQHKADGSFNGWTGFISPFYKLGPAYKLEFN